MYLYVLINVYLVDFNVQERINASINNYKHINHLKKIKARPYEDPKAPWALASTRDGGSDGDGIAPKSMLSKASALPPAST